MNRRFAVILWIVLALSLLLNAAGLGVVLRVNQLRATLSGQDNGLAALSENIDTGFRLLRGHPDDPEFRARLDELGAARHAMFEAARARPYDRSRVQAAMAAVRRATEALQSAGQERLLEGFDKAAGVAGTGQ